MNLFFNHMWNASGGYNTAFYGFLFGYGFISRMTMAGAKVPAVSKYAMAIPTAIVGLAVGSLVFGDHKEMAHLMRNWVTYRSEFNHHQKDIYG